MTAEARPARLAPLVGELAEADLPAADRIFRLAFGTYFGLPEPERFREGVGYVQGRWRAPHVASFGAWLDGVLVGSNFATRWGSVGFFGPLSVRPDVAGRGVAQALLARTVDRFDAWGVTQSGLFTFAQSPLHVGLYQRFGFYPRFLTAVMARPAERAGPVAGAVRFSGLDDGARAAALQACREVSETLYAGLDLGCEIEAVAALGLGDTVLLDGGLGLAGFAICHFGAGSEAGEGACFVKFACVRASAVAEREFGRLLEAAEALAASLGLARLVAGTNLARQEAYELMLGCGFRTVIQGVSMHRGNAAGTCRPGVFAIEDWR